MRKNTNIILDIDNTLVHAVHKCLQAKTIVKGNYEQYVDDNFVIYYRPNLQKFLNYVFKYYNVAIWSAGSKEYVEYITEKVITDYDKNRKLDFVFSWEECKDSMNIYNDTCFKNLKYIWNNDSLPVFRYYNTHNTILIDDLFHTFITQQKNTIWAEYFDVTLASANSDNYLLGLIQNLPQ